MRFRRQGDLDQLITHRIPEGASLEYKSQLPLGPPNERLEALKDLTGMANGGGGTVLYGIDEDRFGEWPVAKEITPLRDFGLPGKLENIWRDGVRPPLLATGSVIELVNGYVLAVDVQPHPVGPYMVELNGNRRHYLRQGTSAVPMTQQQVRDAYTLALRAQERRPLAWANHGLPAPAPDDRTWLVVSALPEEPFGEFLDMSSLNQVDLQPPETIATYMNNSRLGDLAPALQALARWLDGFHGVDDDHDGQKHLVRFFRDGAAMIATRIDSVDGGLWPTYIARVVNTALLYLGWLWTHFDLSRRVELRLDLHNLVGQQLFLGNEGGEPQLSPPISGPDGVVIDPVFISEYVIPWEMSRASVRHQLLMRFSDRMYQAGQQLQAAAPFRRGRLYNSAGVNLDVVVGGSIIYDQINRRQIGTIHTNGALRSSVHGDIVGWYESGVVMDLEGQAVAVLEFAPGAGCPDDFVGKSLHIDPDGVASQLNGSFTDPVKRDEPPGPTATWSIVDVRTLLGN
jgi:hypothetical protein